jgi:hypothetical protein
VKRGADIRMSREASARAERGSSRSAFSPLSTLIATSSPRPARRVGSKWGTLIPRSRLWCRGGVQPRHCSRSGSKACDRPRRRAFEREGISELVLDPLADAILAQAARAGLIRNYG